MRNEKLQERIENIVRNEVLTCQSSLVEELLRKEIVNYDDIVNMYVDNSQEIEDKQTELEELQEVEEPTEEQEKQIDKLERKIEELEEEQENPQEIYEWWVVSNWLAEKLEEYGEPILKSDYETWWGRTCTGQSITLDYVIERIVTDIEKSI